MSDALDLILTCFDASDPLLSPEDLQRWPPEGIERLIASQLLIPTTNSHHVTCPDCPDRHLEEVIVRSRDGKTRFFIHCPESLRVEVPEEQLLRWAANFQAMADALHKALNLTGRCAAVIPGRLWRLGKTPWRRLSREVLLGRGLLWADGQVIADKVGRSGKPIVLVGQEPPPDIWPESVPAVVQLSRVASQSATGIEVDQTLMAAIIEEEDRRTEAAAIRPLTLKDRKLLVRGQLKAEIGSYLKDDQLIAAYKEQGSCRKAAAELSKQLQTTISKDKVQRAVARKRAAAQVESSNSVKRTVASHRCDRKRLFAAPSQSTEPD